MPCRQHIEGGVMTLPDRTDKSSPMRIASNVERASYIWSRVLHCERDDQDAA
jgi:hypothetical protein